MIIVRNFFHFFAFCKRLISLTTALCNRKTMNYRQQSSVNTHFKCTCGYDVGQGWIQKLKHIMTLDKNDWVLAHHISSHYLKRIASSSLKYCEAFIFREWIKKNNYIFNLCAYVYYTPSGNYSLTVLHFLFLWFLLTFAAQSLCRQDLPEVCITTANY